LSSARRFWIFREGTGEDEGEYPWENKRGGKEEEDEGIKLALDVDQPVI